MNRFLSDLRSGAWLTPERMKLWAPLFAGVSILLLGFDFWTHTRFGLVDGKGEQVGRDFVNYWAGARLALHGRADMAYDLRRFLAYERGLTAPNAEVKWYGYPPVAMLLAAPFGALPFLPALAAWTLSAWAVLSRMLAPRMGLFFAACALMATPAFYENALSGQNGAFSAVLLAGGLLLLDERPLLAGVLFGLLCYKPQLGVLIPVALIASGRWRTAFAAGGAIALLVGASMLQVGVQPWVEFLHNAPLHRQILETQTGIWQRMPVVYLSLRWFGAPNALAYAAQGLSALLAATAVFQVWRGPARVALKGASLLIATFLATPYAWDYDMVVLLFAAAWYWGEAEASGWRDWEKTALALMVVSPWFLPALAKYAHLQLGPAVLWLMLGLTLARVRAQARLAQVDIAVTGSLADTQLG